MYDMRVHLKLLQDVVTAVKGYRHGFFPLELKHVPGCRRGLECDCPLRTMHEALDNLDKYMETAKRKPRRPRKPVRTRKPSPGERKYKGTCPACLKEIIVGESEIVLAGSPPEFPTLIGGHCHMSVEMTLIG